MRTCSLIVAAAFLAATSPVDAAPRCFSKTAEGTGANEKVARFQVYEGLLRSVDWGLWSSWIANGETPGYRVGKPQYVCRAGLGLGVSCRGRATICPLPR